MSNPHKGEVEFTVDKKVYTLHFSTNAMCELEEAFGDGVLQIANNMSDPTKLKIKDIRTIFWAGLRDHHETITQVEAGRLMDAVGFAVAAELIGKAFTSAFPEAANAPLAVAGPSASTGKTH